jgi:alpha-tubulin suppressor-like RCC1 family protein
MASGKSFPIFAIILLFIANIGLASMCARLKSVSAGEDHSLALADNGTLWACGGSSINHKQLGLGSDVHDVLSLRQVLGEGGNGHLQNVATYDAGLAHSLAADADGTIWAWGYDDYGQLGNGPNEGDASVPIRVHDVNNDVNGLRNIVAVSAGRSGYHSLAVDSNGYVYAWGLNNSGQCGIGNTSNPLQYPYPVVGDTGSGLLGGPGAKIIAADAGVNHSLALSELSSGGYVWEWGTNNGYSYPRKVPGVGGGFLNHIVGISTCGHSVAVDSNGFVYEWQYGNPYKVPGGEMHTTYLEDVCEVSAGAGYSMARTSDGHVLWWDFGGNPQYVEDGEMETQSDLLEGIISISAGFYDHKLAVCKRGYGWAWGSNNNYGKFGVGDTNPRPEPAQMLCAEVPGYIYLAKTLEGNEPDCFSFDDYITYRITYGPNSCDHNNVVLTDYLQDEVDYVSSSPDGNYNSVLRTVTWNIGPLDANTPNGFVTLTVKVDKCVELDGIITNYCQIENDIGYSDAEYVTYLCSASNPGPACGEIVDLDISEFSLTWCPGRFAADSNGHEVYFGTNYNEVNDADVNDVNVYKGKVNNPSYPIQFSDLDADTTYYWRIDEVNTAHPDLRWRGGVWSFTTGIYLVVDNFESYANNTTLRAVWKKLSTKAIVYLNTDPNLVHNGNKSMQYYYSNSYSPYYSEAYADTTGPNSLPSQIGSDWSDAKLLKLYFYGYAANDPNEQMYVKLTDGSSPAHTATVEYRNYSDMSDIL